MDKVIKKNGLNKNSTWSSVCSISKIKVANVDTVPRKTLAQDSDTNAVLGISNKRANGYIIGIIAHLKNKRKRENTE